MSDGTADWYPDPERPGMLRYWDGQNWTEHSSPAVAPPTSRPDGSDQATAKVLITLVALAALVAMFIYGTSVNQEREDMLSGVSRADSAGQLPLEE